MYPGTENVNLVKDVGMIPYILYKQYGYDSTIVSYRNGEYPYLKKEVNGLKQSFISKVTGHSTLDGLIYIFFNFPKIDILQLYHFNRQTIIWCIFFKLVKLGSCKTYLKLDAGEGIMELNLKPFELKVINYLMRTIDIISTETTTIYNYLRAHWKREIFYVPNGFYDYEMRQELNISEKQNLIITVGRIGTKQKHTEVLLEGFKLFSKENCNWELKIIGPIEEDFKIYIENYFKENPDLTNKVTFTGEITDRKELDGFYQRAKIFALTSRSESFGLVYLEAMRFGCYIVTSNVIPAYDITSNEKYGKVFPIGDHIKLAKSLSEIVSKPDDIMRVMEESQEYVYANFYWPMICGQIDELLKKN